MRRRTFIKTLGLASIVGGIGAVVGIRTARASNRYYQGPISDHFNGTHFFNPDGQAPKGFRELLKWQLGGGRKKWPQSYPSPFKDIPPERVTSQDLRVSFVGHATVLIQTAGLNILTDPVWSKRASPVQWAGPERVNEPGIRFEDLPPIDVILLSHNHYDHLDLLTLDRLRQRDNPKIVLPIGNDAILTSHSGQYSNLVVGDWGDAFSLSNDVSVHFEPVHHWSARGLADRRHALWSGFVLKTPGGSIYHVGDTGFHSGINYRAMRERYGTFRLAILPFGAYEPRDFMSAQHQNPDEAVQGHLLCNAQNTLGHHWGTFQLTNESIEDQLADLAAARSRHNVAEEAFRALQPGESWDIPPDRR